MRMRLILAALAALPAVVMGVTGALAVDAPRLVGPDPFNTEAPAPPIAPDLTDDRRKTRNYPEQPPVIPHNIRDYQIDKNFNRCLSCHSRKYTEQSQAPMISISHYQDRDGNMLGGLAPRRYFCTACHVPQTTATPLVDNTFRDLDAITTPPGGGR